MLPGVPQGGTLNVYSGVRNLLAYMADSPNYADLSLGFEYAIAVLNTTGADITSGTLVLEGADAKADNPCEPDVWHPLEPVADCGPIVSGQPYGPQVQIDITPERPVPAHGLCLYAAPCPKQFLRVTGAPAGTHIVVIITRLRRSDFSHNGPWGGIPRPLTATFGSPLQAPLQAGQQGQIAQRSQRPRQQQPGQQPQQEQPAPHTRHSR